MWLPFPLLPPTLPSLPPPEESVGYSSPVPVPGRLGGDGFRPEGEAASPQGSAVAAAAAAVAHDMSGKAGRSATASVAGPESLGSLDGVPPRLLAAPPPPAPAPSSRLAREAEFIPKAAPGWWSGASMGLAPPPPAPPPPLPSPARAASMLACRSLSEVTDTEAAGSWPLPKEGRRGGGSGGGLLASAAAPSPAPPPGPPRRLCPFLVPPPALPVPARLLCCGPQPSPRDPRPSSPPPPPPPPLPSS